MTGLSGILRLTLARPPNFDQTHVQSPGTGSRCSGVFLPVRKSCIARPCKPATSRLVVLGDRALIPVTCHFLWQCCVVAHDDQKKRLCFKLGFPFTLSTWGLPYLLSWELCRSDFARVVDFHTCNSRTCAHLHGTIQNQTFRVRSNLLDTYHTHIHTTTGVCPSPSNSFFCILYHPTSLAGSDREPG